jgi:hypothetical protein
MPAAPGKGSVGRPGVEPAGAGCPSSPGAASLSPEPPENLPESAEHLHEEIFIF